MTPASDSANIVHTLRPDATSEGAVVPASERELKALLDIAPLGILFTRDRMVVQANALFAEMLRCTLDQLIGQPAHILWPDAESYMELGRLAGPVLAAGDRYQGERQARRHDNTVFWCRISARAIHLTAGSAETLWIVEDISQAREAEERARETFIEQKMIFDNAAVGIMFASRRKIVRCNDRIASIFGYTAAELVGKSTRIFYDSDEQYRSAGLAGYATILAGETYVHEMDVPHKSGRRLTVRANGRQVPRTKPGEDIVWIFEDVTDRRNAQEALLKANESLKISIDELHRAQAELVQTEKLASLGSMVAGIAHELNTPIGNALVSASTLRDTMLQLRADISGGKLRRSVLDAFLRDGAEIAELVIRSTQRAADLVSSFKQVAVDSRSEQRRSFEVLALVEDVLSGVRPVIALQPWTITVRIPEGLACDSFPVAVGQVISQLLDNAIKFAFKDGQAGNLTIEATQDAENLVLRLADDGPGIDAEHLPRIFDPFFTTRLGQGGPGLGLSVAKNIAAGVLHGSLHVSSEPGHGACFTLKFPLNAPAH